MELTVTGGPDTRAPRVNHKGPFSTWFFLRAYGAYSEMQAELDLALIAAIKQIDNLDTDDLEEVIEDWFSAQTRLADYDLGDISIDKNGSTITATASAVVPSAVAPTGAVVIGFAAPLPSHCAERIATPKLFAAGPTLSAYSFASIPFGNRTR